MQSEGTVEAAKPSPPHSPFHSNEKRDIWRLTFRVVKLGLVAPHAMISHFLCRNYSACACIFNVPV
jgi:hypothetical protein